MRATFHAELHELIIDLAKMTRLAGQTMTNASITLHQSDLALARLVIADCDQLGAKLHEAEQRCITLLALQAPVAGDLRVVVTAMRAIPHLARMGHLARHVAIIARLKHPNPVVSDRVRSVLARMSLLASQLAEDAATAIEHQDPVSGCRLGKQDDGVDALQRHLFGMLLAEDWTYGVEQAVDAALIGRYYERFADHAVAIARQVCYLATGRVPEHTALETSSGPAA